VLEGWRKLVGRFVRRRRLPHRLPKRFIDRGRECSRLTFPRLPAEKAFSAAVAIAKEAKFRAENRNVPRAKRVELGLATGTADRRRSPGKRGGTRFLGRGGR
jgi:hypothetical protein